jgi:hypothetical protein
MFISTKIKAARKKRTKDNSNLILVHEFVYACPTRNKLSTIEYRIKAGCYISITSENFVIIGLKQTWFSIS